MHMMGYKLFNSNIVVEFLVKVSEETTSLVRSYLIIAAIENYVATCSYIEGHPLFMHA